jgi:hypothetical protein
MFSLLKLMMHRFDGEQWVPIGEIVEVSALQ